MIILGTVLERLQWDIESIKSLFNEFLLKYSEIKYSPLPNNGVVVFIASDYHWGKLDDEGKVLQNRLYKEYKSFTELCRILISDLPSDKIHSFDECSREIVEYIEQNRMIWLESTNEVLQRVLIRLEEQYSILKTLYDSKTDTYIVIPDTNALLSSPSFEKWHFKDISTFEILFLPTVLSELDRLKVYHSNRDVKEKASSIIKRIKELRSRGNLADGAAIVKHKIFARTIAIEPDFENTLPWLKQDNDDDRIIASLVEVMRQHPNCNIILVTADINLQNKIEFARLPFIEPPEEIQ